MVRQVKHITLTALITLLLGPAAAAQTETASAQSSKSDWDNLKRLTSGAEIRIKTTDGEPFRGQFQSVTDQSLVVVKSTNQETLARRSVAGVSLKRNSHRKRNLLVGLAVGAGVGLIIGFVADRQTCHNSFGCLNILGPNIGKEVLTPAGALIGLGIGALLPTGAWREVYRSR